ncbi:unnamed protein product [Lepeophtheirus salmonis]|uniref:(salmon louse) hypothetical protein n=1 Tax=Lepeophtheirus salmonis TaxID=72036 RepID=A0A7R8D081_LEPSM|nr:unnamed protein product [Lepeophtheirus salmonis]CAF2981470.1 unnamed protein product [Lepeophtheirus salmonis]
MVLNSPTESGSDEPSNTKLTVLDFNKCLSALGESPQNMPKKRHKTWKAIQNKLINIYGGLDLVSDINVDEETTNALKAQEFDQLIKDLLDKFNNSTKKKSEEIKVLTIVSHIWPIRKIQNTFKTTYHFANLPRG